MQVPLSTKTSLETAQKLEEYLKTTGKTKTSVVEAALKKYMEVSAMKNTWKIEKIQDGIATYKNNGMTIKITDAKNDSGCYELKMYNKAGKQVKSAFWHGGDMDIPDNVDSVWTDYFGSADFPGCLDWVDWDEK